MMQLKLTPVLLLVLWLAGCMTAPVKEPTPPPPMVAIEPAPKQAPVRQKRIAPLPPPPVAILVSQPLAPYTEVADRLKKRMGGQARIYHLPSSSSERSKLLQQIGDEKRLQLVTIGLDASLLAKQLPGHNQVFCQVFNYTQYDLARPRCKGVSMLPGVEKTLATWKSISPSLHDIAVISGPGLEAVLQRAAELAAKQGIELHRVTVANDKEYLYAYKQLAEKVQGYWLIPDNRVLSVRALKEVMNFSVRNSKQVVVFNRELLRLGGLFSVTPNYDDIAEKVLLRLGRAADKDSVPGIDLIPLDEIELKVNPVMVQRLGLSLPDEYREAAGEKSTE